MFQLPYARKHVATGHSVVHTVIWVRFVSFVIEKSDFFGQIIAIGSQACEHIAFLSFWALLCRSCMVSKSITDCLSVDQCCFTGGPLSICVWRSQDNRQTGHLFLKNTSISWTFSVSVYLSIVLPGLTLKSTTSSWWTCQPSLGIQLSLCPSDCRYYGLSVWFPDVIKHLQADEYASKVKIHNNERIEDFTFNFTLENQIHKNGLFINDQ